MNLAKSLTWNVQYTCTLYNVIWIGNSAEFVRQKKGEQGGIFIKQKVASSSAFIV
jgi:hypothetical protein